MVKVDEKTLHEDEKLFFVDKYGKEIGVFFDMGHEETVNMRKNKGIVRQIQKNRHDKKTYC